MDRQSLQQPVHSSARPAQPYPQQVQSHPAAAQRIQQYAPHAHYGPYAPYPPHYVHTPQTQPVYVAQPYAQPHHAAYHHPQFMQQLHSSPQLAGSYPPTHMSQPPYEYARSLPIQAHAKLSQQLPPSHIYGREYYVRYPNELAYQPYPYPSNVQPQPDLSTYQHPPLHQSSHAHLPNQQPHPVLHQQAFVKSIDEMQPTAPSQTPIVDPTPPTPLGHVAASHALLGSTLDQPTDLFIDTKSAASSAPARSNPSTSSAPSTKTPTAGQKRPISSPESNPKSGHGPSEPQSANAHSTNQASTDDQQTNPVKRRRATKACDTCNRKKIRCDGKQPLCGYCSHSGQPCTYSRLARKRGPKPGYIEELESRVKELEQLLGNLPKDDVGMAAAAAALMDASGTNGHLSQDGDAFVYAENDVHLGGDQEDDLDYNDDMDLNSEYNNQSETFSSVRDQPASAEQSVGASTQHSSISTVSGPPKQSASASAVVSNGNQVENNQILQKSITQSISDSSIDTIELQVDLIDYFFTYLYPSFPVLHRPTFMQKAKSESPLLMNALYAYTSHFAYPDRPDAALAYDTAARRYINHSIEYPNHSNIIGIILLSLFASNMGQMTESWVYFGMAVRIAQQIRLHIEPSLDHTATYTSHEQEQRRRIWWSLYEADRFMCITSKLPFAIRELDFKVQYPCSEALWLRGGCGDSFKSINDHNTSITDIIDDCCAGQIDSPAKCSRFHSAGRDAAEPITKPTALTTSTPNCIVLTNTNPNDNHRHQDYDAMANSTEIMALASRSVASTGIVSVARSPPRFSENFSIDYYYMQLLELATAIITFDRSTRTTVREVDAHAHELEMQVVALEKELQKWQNRAPSWLLRAADAYCDGLDVDVYTWESNDHNFMDGHANASHVVNRVGMPHSMHPSSKSMLPSKTRSLDQDGQVARNNESQIINQNAVRRPLPWKAAFVQIFFHYLRILLHGQQLTRLLADPQKPVSFGFELTSIAESAASIYPSMPQHHQQMIQSFDMSVQSHPSFTLSMNAAYAISRLVDQSLDRNPDFRYVSPFIHVGIVAAGDVLLQSCRTVTTIAMMHAASVTTKTSTDTLNASCLAYQKATLAIVDRFVDALQHISTVSSLASSTLTTLVRKRQTILSSPIFASLLSS